VRIAIHRHRIFILGKVIRKMAIQHKNWHRPRPTSTAQLRTIRNNNTAGHSIRRQNQELG
jgi:hypothetical protein